VWHCLCDPTFSLCSRTPTCNRQKDRHTTTAYTALAWRRAVKTESCWCRICHSTSTSPQVSAKCFFQLRQLRHIRRSVDDHSAATLIHAWLASLVDYCGCFLISSPKTPTNKLQRVLNTRKYDQGLTQYRQSKLHWLDVNDRVRSRVLSRCSSVCTTHDAWIPVVTLPTRVQCSWSPSPAPLSWSASTICQDDDHSALPIPTASWYRQSNCQQSAAEPLRLRLQTPGTDCQLMSSEQIHCQLFVDY